MTAQAAHGAGHGGEGCAQCPACLDGSSSPCCSLTAPCCIPKLAAGGCCQLFLSSLSPSTLGPCWDSGYCLCTSSWGQGGDVFSSSKRTDLHPGKQDGTRACQNNSVGV